MVLLSAEKISKSYGDRTLFKDVSFTLTADDRVGLIGVNGSGKSTLLRVLLEREPPDSGRITKARGAQIELLEQEPAFNQDHTALEAVLADGPEAFAVVQAYEAACRALSLDPENMARIDEVARLGEEMDRVDGWNLETQARTILSKLGVEDLEQPIKTMSGGQQKRVALARALVRPADLLILDEPTNHLDVETVAWLEGYLASRTAGLLLITHDRYFLERVTNVILELADQTVYRHQGRYSDFLEAREARQERLRVEEHKRKQLAKKELEWLRRGPKARTTKSRARIQRAEALQTSEYTVDAQRVEIDTVESRLGRKTIELEQVSRAQGDKIILKDFNFQLDRRDRLGIIGPNGVGKSTLLDLIAGRIKPDSGRVEQGETVVVGYYDQVARELDPTMRVHDYITEVAHRIPTSDGSLSASQMLERFLFDRQKQWTYIEKLSGGERRRLYLLRVLMGQPNVLLLDEPTNDLDVETLAILEDYLDSFDGAVIAVSHDRYFLDRAMEHLLVFHGNGEVEEIPGTYSYYEDRLEEERRRQAEREAQKAEEQAKKAAQAAPKQRAAGLSYKEKRELEALEKRIEEIEEALEGLDGEMVARAADYQALAELDEKKQALSSELEEGLERWMELSERAE